MQRYSYSPGSKSLVSTVNVAPASIKLESNVSPKSAELVTVCATVSTFVHSTMCPCGTIATSGS